LTAAYSSLERMDEARSAASELLKLHPTFSLVDFEKTLPYKNLADTEFMVNALKKAGLQ
jgi:adenylate cyclase